MDEPGALRIWVYCRDSSVVLPELIFLVENIKTNLFCYKKTEVMNCPSSGSNHGKIYDMRRLFCLDITEIKRCTGNNIKKN